MVISPGGEVAGGETGGDAGKKEKTAKGETIEEETGAEKKRLYL